MPDPYTAVDLDDPLPVEEQAIIDDGWASGDLIRVCSGRCAPRFDSGGPKPTASVHCNCEADMIDRGCKLRCPRCGFFLGCSDHL